MLRLMLSASSHLTELVLGSLGGQVPAGIFAPGHRRWSLPFPGPDPGWGPRGLLRAQR